jgi:predicted nucleotide-binding protein (sugar kinase/HSP70/actin superfamily)
LSVIRKSSDQCRENRGKQCSADQSFLSLHNKDKLAQRLVEVFADWKVTRQEVKTALAQGFAELDRVKDDIRAKGQEALQFLVDHDCKGIVLSGRPYHVDPEIHHGIPQMINTLGLAVLTEDSVAGLGDLERPLRVVDQWAYHSRLYERPRFVPVSPPRTGPADILWLRPRCGHV